MGVISLEEASRTDIASAGGKGANLGELIQSGFPVPPGFIVCAEVYEAFMGNLNIPKRSNDAYGSAEYRDQVQSQILENKIPAGILDEISSHHSATLKKVPLKQSATELQYAVRSSATAEDLGDASFAGQHDTYYYVTELQLHEMIKKCWASLWSDAAFSYRVSQGIDHHSVNMAVIVQVMIQSEISGVTFTADPVSGDQNLIVTESSWGMGAAIVDGRVSPDQYIVRKDTEVVQSKRIADKKFMVPASIADTDSRLSPVPASLRLSETLSASRLDTLTHWAKKSEAYFGSQQDIEWAFTADEFFILQSRPVTVMGQKEDEIPRGEFVLFKPLAENFTDPLLPLSQDLFVKLFPMMVIIQGRVYTRLSHVRPLFPFKMTNEQIAQLAYLSSSSEVKPILSIIGLLRLATILLVAHLILGVLFRRTSNLPVDFMDSFRHSFKKVVDDDRVDAYGALESLFFKSRFFEPVGNMPLMVNLSAPRYMFLLAAITRLLKLWIPDIRYDAASYLTSGTEGILSTDMGRHIWALAKKAKQNAAVRQIIVDNDPNSALNMLRGHGSGQEFLIGLNEFLAIHGHRTLKEFEINSVRWEEDPSPVIAMIRNYLQSEANPTETEERVRSDRQAFIQQVRNKLGDRFLEKSTGIRWRLIEFLRNRARYFIRLRENSRFYHIMGFYAVRKKVLKIEESLLNQGKLKCKDDVYYLMWDEIRSLEEGELTWDDVEALIRERRMDFIRLSKLTPAKTIGIEITESSNTTTNSIEGQGASPGSYEGIARVVMDPGTDAELHPGEILVAPYTDPAWTPLFLTANAAVVEVGSYLSHAGTIAREYGMPCVVDAADCTLRIKSGDRIVVDGTNGLVNLLIEEQ